MAEPVVAEGPPLPTRMVLAGMALFDRFTTEQRARVLMPFDHEDRDNWDFLPAGGRLGLPLRDMTHQQQILVHQLIGSAMTPEAYAKVVTTMELEHILREIQAPFMGPLAVQFRDPMGYFLSLFGMPNLDETWGWRFVGHHVSLNVTVVRQRYASLTPMMLGAEPGRFGHIRHLADEEDSGFDLLDSLDGSRRDKAIIHPQSPTDLVTKSVRRVADVEYPGYNVVGRHQLAIDDDDRKALVFMREHPRGVAYGEMSDTQQAKLRAVLECYIGRVKPDQMAYEMDRITAAGIDHLHFAWAGGTDYDHGHYYRIQGPVTIIEFDNAPTVSSWFSQSQPRPSS